MITQIHHKKNELFEVEFYKDKECTKFIKRLPYAENAKKSEISNFYIELVNGDITPLTSLLLLSYNVNDYFYIPYIPNYKLFNLFAHNYKVKTLDDITPNLSKYIPEDNAVLFLSEEGFFNYGKCFKGLDLVASLEKLNTGIVSYKKLTIFLPHGTQSELQKAKEVAKELKEKYGVEEVNLFVLHNFLKLTDRWDYDLAETLFDGVTFGGERSPARIFSKFANMTPRERVSTVFINKIITTNSRNILEPQNSERLQVIDCREVFEEYLNGNNLMQTL